MFSSCSSLALDSHLSQELQKWKQTLSNPDIHSFVSHQNLFFLIPSFYVAIHLAHSILGCCCNKHSHIKSNHICQLVSGLLPLLQCNKQHHLSLKSVYFKHQSYSLQPQRRLLMIKHSGHSKTGCLAGWMNEIYKQLSQCQLRFLEHVSGTNADFIALIIKLSK